MSKTATGDFSAKHAPHAVANPTVRKNILSRARDKTLPCAVAFDIALQCGVSPEQVGRDVDLARIRLIKCQLGLFGYQPNKKIVTAAATIDEQIRQAVEAEATQGRLSCAAVWRIARHQGVRKMTVSSVCEALQVKIKPCQLGAF